jgi:hypothetical protein
MKRLQNRREFAGLIAAGIVGVAGSRSLGALFAEGLDPDLVVFNAKIKYSCQLFGLSLIDICAATLASRLRSFSKHRFFSVVR